MLTASLEKGIAVAGPGESRTAVPFEVRKRLRAHLAALKADTEVARILAEGAEVDALLQLIKSDDNWILVKDTKTLRTHYRYDQGNPYLSIRLSGIVKTACLNCLPLVAEPNLM